MNNQYRISKPSSDPFASYKSVRAKISQVHENIRVFVDTEEEIFQEIYVTGALPNNRLVKFKKSALEFIK
jgi:hypothetical protein